MPQADTPAMVATPTRNRTDGGAGSKQALQYVAGMPNYGDGQELMSLEASAPMAKAQTASPMSPEAVAQAAAAAPAANVVPLNAPSQQPDVHVTDGTAQALALPAQPSPEMLGYQNALSLLNQLGNDVSPQVAAIRNSLAAHLNNQTVKP